MAQDGANDESCVREEEEEMVTFYASKTRPFLFLHLSLSLLLRSIKMMDCLPHLLAFLADCKKDREAKAQRGGKIHHQHNASHSHHTPDSGIPTYVGKVPHLLLDGWGRKFGYFKNDVRFPALDRRSRRGSLRRT